MLRLDHLLAREERAKLIRDCYHQLRPNGYMVFVAISKNDAAYGQGEMLEKDRFETKHGVQLYFYDADAIQEEFGEYGLVESKEINKPARNTEKGRAQKCWMITCQKQEA